MARLLKCPECGLKNPKDATVEHSKRYYCVPCYSEMQKRKSERDYLIKYIAALYGLNTNNKFDGRLLKDLKNLNEEGYTYQDIYLTLKYCEEVEKLQFNIQYGLGCVRFYKNKALEHFNTLKRRKSNARAISLIEEETVSLRYAPSKATIRNKKHINIESL